MRLYVLVEGPSEKALLDVWLGRLLKGHRYTVIKHRGKGKLPLDPRARVDPRREGLLDQLPARLRAYGQALDPSTDLNPASAQGNSGARGHIVRAPLTPTCTRPTACPGSPARQS